MLLKAISIISGSLCIGLSPNQWKAIIKNQEGQVEMESHHFADCTIPGIFKGNFRVFRGFAEIFECSFRKIS